MASNTHGEIMTSMYLNVLAVPARIEQPPPELTLATESGEAAIHCGVFGSPKPKVTWSFNGQ
ncbi:tyrosine-protein kinase-like otk, partial [Saccoglossus kowalevskii]